ncbi:hypothetical protein OBBRIDRAFT_716795, partial [Obba rivulosa]
AAVFTAFNVELCTTPSPDNTDLTVQLLRQISADVTSPLRLDTASSSNFKPPTWSVWVNVLWFSSLVLSLTSASIGLTVRKWIGHFASPTVPDSTRNSAYIHCLRYDAGFVVW